MDATARLASSGVAATPLTRAEFAVTKTLNYLNHAAVGVLPNRTRAALDGFTRAHAERGVLGTAPYESRFPAYRERIARFINADAGEIALLRNTADGANVIAHGLDWRSGDEIVTNDNEFGSNALPWLALRERGVTVRFIPTARERMTPDVLRRTMTDKTRLVAVSWVTFNDGYRHDLAGLSEVAHAGGALFCVDAIQALGAFPLDVRAAGIDAAYAGGAKWLLALQGVSFLYVRTALLERLALRWPGWRSVADIWDFLAYVGHDQPWAPDATRFEGGTINFAGAVSLDASLAVLEEAGVANIGAHVLALTDRLVEGLRAQGAEVAGRRGEGISSGIVTFRLPGRDPVQLGRALAAAGIVTTYRPSGVRVAPHGYNSFDEIDALLEALRERSRASVQ